MRFQPSFFFNAVVVWMFVSVEVMLVGVIIVLGEW